MTAEFFSAAVESLDALSGTDGGWDWWPDCRLYSRRGIPLRAKCVSRSMPDVERARQLFSAGQVVAHQFHKTDKAMSLFALTEICGAGQDEEVRSQPILILQPGETDDSSAPAHDR
jgi:hypothetical protein